ncbi:hypothetical protein L9F63_027318, partial [Diploptera punctata]
RFIGSMIEVRRNHQKRHNTGRPEATDDGDKLRNCSIEEKGYEENIFCHSILHRLSVSISISTKEDSDKEKLMFKLGLDPRISDS